MSTFEHTDSALASDAPPLAAAKPPLPFMGASRRRFSSGPGQDDPPHPARQRCLFIFGRRKPTIPRGQIGRAAEDHHVSIKRGRPQRHVGRPGGMHLIGGDDLMLGFLNRDQLPEFGGLCDLALPNRFGMRFKDAEDFVGHVRVSGLRA